MKAEQEAKAKAEEKARIKVEQEAKAKADAKVEKEAIEQEVEEETRVKIEQDAKVEVEQEATSKVEAEQEAMVKAEQEAKGTAEGEARVKAEQEARAKVEAEAEQEARVKAEQETRVEAEQDAKAKAEAEGKARIKAEESRVKVEDEARVRAEKEAKAKAEDEARTKAEDEAKAKAEEEARIKVEEEARVKTEEEKKATAKAKVEEEARIKAEDEAKAKAEEEARVKAEQEANAKAEEEARVEAEEVRVKAEQETKLKAEEEEETEPKAVEEIVSVEETRISELERLEREFGLIDPIAKSDHKVSEQVDPGTGYFFTESRKVDSKSNGERSSETLEKSKEKFNQIQREQREVTARLVELERLRENQINRVGTRNMGGVEDLEQTTSEDSRFLEEATYDKEEGQVEEHNLVDDEAIKLADTVTASDKLYIPSKKALASTPFFMKEVAGTSLENYSGKEGLFSERDVGVHAGNTLKVPVRVSVPGSIVEFSIEKKSYDFSFGINAFLDEGQVVKIKVCKIKTVLVKFQKYEVWDLRLEGNR